MESGFKQLTATDLADVTTSKQEGYGPGGIAADGRRYAYVQFGGTVNPGQLVVAAATVANHLNIAVAAAAAAKATQVSVTLGATAATQDQYAGGYLVVGTDSSGVPQTRRIKGNTAGASGATITVILEDKEPLVAALTTSNKVSLIPNPYSYVTASSTAGIPVGVAVVGGTSGTFGWVQYGGPCGVINDSGGTVAANAPIKQSTTVAGSVAAVSAATDIDLGYLVHSAAAGKSALAMLNITA